jgi:DNA-binding NarL/FixJ family response regulator
LNQVQPKNPPASLIPALPREAYDAPIRLLIISKSRRLIETMQANCRLEPADRVDITWLADPLPASGPPTQPQPDMILLDAVTPECRMTRLLQTARNQYPTAKFILLENTPTPDLVPQIVEFKICGLLPREVDPEVCRKALQIVHNGELWLPHLVITQIFAFFSEKYRLIHLTTTNAPMLTVREQAIAGLVAQGWTNKEIARQLNLSPETIKKHLKNIFVKLGAQKRSELASMYVTMVGRTIQRLA